MDATIDKNNEKKSKLVINLISIIVPALVILMLAFPNKIELGTWTKSLPHAIGSVNTLTTLALIAGLIFIKQGKLNLHRYAMGFAFSLGGVFLVCYVMYHISNPANRFNGEGFVRYFYLITLLTHILMSLIVLPLVLRAMYYAITKQFQRHKKIVKYAYPTWLYVSVTGVIVYLMLYIIFPNN